MLRSEQWGKAAAARFFYFKYIPGKPPPSGAPSIPSRHPCPIVTKKELNLWSTKTVSCKLLVTAGC